MLLFRPIVAFTIISAVVSTLIPNVSAAPLPFPDMEWSFYRYKEAVQYLKTRRIISGDPDGNFRPGDTVNRAEFLKMLLHDDRDIIDPDRRCFSDVNPREWYAPYICTAKERAIVQGYSDGYFRPGDPVNFAEAIKMAMGVHEIAHGDTPKNPWYKPYTIALENADLLAEHSYVPWENLSRERAADILWRIVRYKEERIIPRLSPGCGKAAPNPPTSVMVDGINRQFLLTVPKKYVPHDPTPLIVAFHGRTNSNEQVRQYMKLDREISDAIIAYPAALSNGNGSYSWANPGDRAEKIRDVKFFDAIVEKLAQSYCIDMDRISTVGHSLGAWMANTVACIRGGVVMASATSGGDSILTDCTGPASAMIAHNPKDNLAPFSGSERVRELRMEENQCDPTETVPGPSSLQCLRYPTCASGTEILFCPFTQSTDHRGVHYPHVWPDGMAKEIDAFFSSLQ